MSLVRRPLTKKVGVPLTPNFWPSMRSRSTFSAKVPPSSAASNLARARGLGRLGRLAGLRMHVEREVADDEADAVAVLRDQPLQRGLGRRAGRALVVCELDAGDRGAHLA